MSRFSSICLVTDKINEYCIEKFGDKAELAFIAYGLDHDGYFIQIEVEILEVRDLYIEEGLIGYNKNRFIETLEKWGLLEWFLTTFPDHYGKICMDNPL